MASQAGCIKSLNFLITKYAVDVNVFTEKSRKTPLHLAAKEGYAQTVQFLLDKGAVINRQDKNGRTALHLSSAAGHEECVDILLGVNDLDRTITDCSGLTAEDLALEPAVRQMLKSVAE